jgi:alpha-L-fucosidase
MKEVIPLCMFFAAASLAANTATRYEANWASLDKRPVPEWYSDAKFGIFIHWGAYSVPSWAPLANDSGDGLGEYSEWYWFRITTGRKEDRVWRDFHDRNYGKNFDYMDFAPRFTAELFDARQWADLFARSGAKYIVPTSKHHDGFALWPSAEASRTWGRPWNAVEIGPKRDVLGELAGAVRARGLKFGLYFSLYEWHNPLWLSDRPRYIKEHMFPQFKDVVTRHQPSLIFSDGEWDLPSKEWGSEDLVAWLYNESPSREDVIINDRWGKETRHNHGGYWTTEYAAGLADNSHAWEESRGLGSSYALNRAERIGDYKTSRELLFVLIDLVSRGGNLLLDIGPAADGTIPPVMEERLLEIGAWLGVNGEAIYGTRPAGRPCQWTEGRRLQQEYGEYQVKYDLMQQIGQKPRDGNAVRQVFFTQKPDALYAITAGWPGNRLVLKDVRVPDDAKVTMFGVPGVLKYTKKGGSIIIEIPDIGPDALPCRDAFVLKITNAAALPQPPADETK